MTVNTVHTLAPCVLCGCVLCEGARVALHVGVCSGGVVCECCVGVCSHKECMLTVCALRCSIAVLQTADGGEEAG
jgi:hypothetical protein